MAVLSFLDFFQTSVQRVAVATAAAMCRGLTSDSVTAVSGAVPILTNLLQYQVGADIRHLSLLFFDHVLMMAHLICGHSPTPR